MKKNDNYCSKCNPLTNLCAKCEFDILTPDEYGGCIGIQKCTLGYNNFKYAVAILIIALELMIYSIKKVAV